MGIIPRPTWPQATRRRRRRRSMAVGLLMALLPLAGCAPPWAAQPAPLPTRHVATPTAAPRAPLADRSIYWSSSSLLMALRASDGALRWKVGDWSGPLPGGITYIYAGPNAPTLADGMLYANVLVPSLAVEAYSAADGVRRWHTSLEGCFNIIYTAQSPLVVGGMVYIAAEGHDCATGGRVYALRTRDGAIAWQAPLERVLSPAHAFLDGTLFISSASSAHSERNYLTALRASDGSWLWRQQLDLYFATATSAGDGLVFVGGGYTANGSAVEAHRASDGTLVWRFPMARYDLPEPLVIGDTVYFSTTDGTFYALRARDGAVKWRVPLGTRVGGPPALAGDLVYVGAGTTLFGLSTRTGAIMRVYHPYAEQELRDPSTWLIDYSAPVVSDREIFFATSAQSCAVHCHLFPSGTTLYALDAETGAQLWARTESPGLPLALTLGP